MSFPDTPASVFDEVIARRADLDMQAKMREDPLFEIRRKEEDARRKLLENPIKMKRLEKVVSGHFWSDLSTNECHTRKACVKIRLM